MQKKIIALAIAAAVSAPAFADNSNVTIYGQARVSFDLVNTGANAAGTAGVSANKVSSNTSRLGLKGSEDLGDGLAAIWQIEQQIDIDTGANTLATRNTFAGLKNESAGTVLMGRHDTPYKLATRKLDMFADTIADNRSLMGGVSATNIAAATLAANGKSVGSSFDGRPTNVLAYISPAMSGFTAAAAYVAGAETATAGQIKGNAWSVAGMYDAAPFYGSLAYENHKLGSVGSGTVAAPGAALNVAGLTESAWKIGAGYTIDAFTLGFAYERTNDNFGAAGANFLGHNAYYLSGKYSFGTDAVKLAYTKVGKLGAAVNTDAKQFSLGYDHNLSKRTTLFALYTKLSNGTAVNYGLSTNGTGGNNTQNGAGASPSAWSFGMNHTF
ncbi:porin [Ferrigenium kumadai]|uniref:Porin n=1 Tax=Ferrigenium kumadai TaxID=1682490 RepID=A0AAN1SXC6_9PROT|nr:porin [Ferrigenium kumadai]BBI98502.1 porin [Ferrigenium kumadai]